MTRSTETPTPDEVRRAAYAKYLAMKWYLETRKQADAAWAAYLITEEDDFVVREAVERASWRQDGANA